MRFSSAGIDEADLLEYLITDDDTHVILMCIEGIKTGDRLLEVLNGGTQHKPIVVIKAGDPNAARSLLLRTPSDDVDVTLVPGVNDDMYNRDQHQVLSMASCTTNSLAPVAKVLQERFGLVQLFITRCMPIPPASRSWTSPRASGVAAAPGCCR